MLLRPVIFGPRCELCRPGCTREDPPYLVDVRVKGTGKVLRNLLACENCAALASEVVDLIEVNAQASRLL
jgi:hypothetical protein